MKQKHDTVYCQGIINIAQGAEGNRPEKKKMRIEIFEKHASSRGCIRPWRRFRATKPAWRHSFDDVWSTAVNAPSRRFLQGTIMLGSLAPTSCAFVHVHGGRALRCTCARYTAKYRVSIKYAFCTRWENSRLRDFARSSSSRRHYRLPRL